MASYTQLPTTPHVVDRSSLRPVPAGFLPTPDSQRPTTVYYQDDFATPGISPRNANPRKHRRQSPNLRRNARGRPQIWQRLWRRVENFGRACLAVRATSNFFWILASLTRFAVVAKSCSCRDAAGSVSNVAELRLYKLFMSCGTAFPCASTAPAPDCRRAP